MTGNDERLTLWLGRKLSVAQGNATQEILISDISERVEQGAPLIEAMKAVTKHDARAGDFGVEMVGSLVAMAVLEGLKVFWSAYIKELEEKAGKSLANATLEFIKSKFRADVSGPGKVAIEAKVTNAIAAAGTQLKIDSAEMAPVLTAVGPAIAADAN